MEIGNNNQSENQDISDGEAEFVRNVLEIIPNTDEEYVRARARDLVGHEAAIGRFILELSNDPTPPPNWKQIYLHPATGGAIESLQKENPVAGPSIPAPEVLPEEIEDFEAASLLLDETEEIETPEEAALWKEFEQEEALWKSNKEAELCEIFPNYSPEWLAQQIQGFIAEVGPNEGRFIEKVAQIMEMDNSNIPSRREWEEQNKD